MSRFGSSLMWALCICLVAQIGAAASQATPRWLTHATAAYTSWQEGDVVSAQMEAEAAVKLAPRNLLALTNYAAICEALDDCATALPLYERAGKIDPNSQVAWLGRVRCNSKLGRPADALAVLQEMSGLERSSFDWYFELAQTCLQMDEPRLAEQAAARAFALASNRKQKGDACEQRMLALLREGRLDEARAIERDLFTVYQPKDYEVYVRAAAVLTDKDPNSADELLSAATRNLDQLDDGEGLYRLGRIFELKGGDAWLQRAEVAFRRAIVLNPRMGKFHVGLAGVLGQKGASAEMKSELAAATSLDGSDFLAKHLSSLPEERLAKLGMTRIEFQLRGLNCACHVGKLAAALRNVDGVAFADASAREPYDACVIIDEKIVSFSDAAAKAKQKAFEGMKDSFTSVEFVEKRRGKCDTAFQAIVAAQQAMDGDVLHFMHQFGGIQPVMPVEPIAVVNRKDPTYKAEQ